MAETFLYEDLRMIIGCVPETGDEQYLLFRTEDEKSRPYRFQRGCLESVAAANLDHLEHKLEWWIPRF